MQEPCGGGVFSSSKMERSLPMRPVSQMAKAKNPRTVVGLKPDTLCDIIWSTVARPPLAVGGVSRTGGDYAGPRC